MCETWRGPIAVENPVRNGPHVKLLAGVAGWDVLSETKLNKEDLERSNGPLTGEQGEARNRQTQANGGPGAYLNLEDIV